MLYRRRARKLGRHLARELRASIIHNPDVWKLTPHNALDGFTEIFSGPFTVTIQPSKQLPAVRIFDRCRLCYSGGDVWLSLWQRIRLKNCVRYYIANRAYRRS